MVSKLEAEFWKLDSKYWNNFYETKASSLNRKPQEYYVLWDDINSDVRTVLEKFPDKELEILVPACGDSMVSKRLHDMGHSISNVDFSSKLIELMMGIHPEMNWIVKDVTSPLEDPPALNPRSYDIVIDKGCFDSIAVEIRWEYLVKVKRLLKDMGIFICISRPNMVDHLAFICRRFWLGWKVTIQKVFPNEKKEDVVMLVVERCPELVHDIVEPVEVDKKLSSHAKKENRIRSKFKLRAQTKEIFELDLRKHGMKTCFEVDYFGYRVIILTDDKPHELNKVDIICVPEDCPMLVLDSNCLTDANHGKLEYFFSEVSTSKMLFIVLSPKLHMHDCMQTSRIHSDLQPLLESFDLDFQVGSVNMWDAHYDSILWDMEHLPVSFFTKSSNTKSAITAKGKRRDKHKVNPKQSGRGDDSRSSYTVTSQDLKSTVEKKKGGQEKLERGDDRRQGDIVPGNSNETEQPDPVVVSTEEVIEAETKNLGIPLDFPKFTDGDEIPYYSEPFTLKNWLLEHSKKEDRWLPQYTRWKDIFPSENYDSPCLLKRECLKILQSVITGMLNYHENVGVHGELSNLEKFEVSQVVVDHVGSKCIRFNTRILPPTLSPPDHLSMQHDVKDIFKIFENILEGEKGMNEEMDYFSQCLFEYPFECERWKKLLLKDYPALWDGKERAEFIIKLYLQLNSYADKSLELHQAIYCVNIISLNLGNWINEIPPNCVLQKVLHGYEPSNNEGEAEGSSSSDCKKLKCAVKYTMGQRHDAMRYMRAALHHFREKELAGDLDIRYVEAALSMLLKNLTLVAYAGMCEAGLFL